MSTTTSAGSVLIVGSSPGGMIVARNLLARAGYAVLTSGTLSEGLKLARQIQPTALLLDDALAHAATLREFLRRVPDRVRVVLSVPKGRATELLSSTIAAQVWPLAQVVGVIEKPYDSETLLNALRRDHASEPPPGRRRPPIEPEGEEQEEEIVLSGRLGIVPVDQVLQIAENVAVPICCRFDSHGTRIEIFVRARRVVYAQRVDLPGSPSSSDLETSAAARTEALVYETLRWSTGRFSLIAHTKLPAEAETAQLGLVVSALLLEGMLRLDAWRMQSRAEA